MITTAQRQKLIADLSQIEDEKIWLQISDILAEVEAKVRGSAKPRAYPGFGGELGRTVADAVVRYDHEQGVAQ